MTPAAFRACYADWKLVKTRSTVQIVLEVPVEQAGLAYEVLGGMPTPGSEIWCAVARLEAAKESAAEPRPQPLVTAPAGGAQHKSFHEMSPAQQAGILCNEPSFMKWAGMESAAEAADWVRRKCAVKSRAEIQPNNATWRMIVSDYRAWMREPAVVG